MFDTEFIEEHDVENLIDIISSLHNLLCEQVTGERYNYAFHWANKIGSDVTDNMFDDLIKEEINMENLVHFELNDWFAGRDYPEGEPFETWVTDNKFITDDEWCKKNKLVVLCGAIDMSINWCITATESWVKENCPQLLSDKAYDYIVLLHGANGTEELTEHNSYSKFLRHPNEDGDVYGRFGWEFPEYTEENFGVHYHKEDYEYEDYDDDDEDDEEIDE